MQRLLDGRDKVVDGSFHLFRTDVLLNRHEIAEYNKVLAAQSPARVRDDHQLVNVQNRNILLLWEQQLLEENYRGQKLLKFDVELLDHGLQIEERVVLRHLVDYRESSIDVVQVIVQLETL